MLSLLIENKNIWIQKLLRIEIRSKRRSYEGYDRVKKFNIRTLNEKHEALYV